MSKDFFKHKAEIYDKTQSRVDNVANIANKIINHVHLDQSMHLMDFGSGTGLLLERIAPFVKKITAVDVSESMNKQLEAKRVYLKCDLDILALDLNTTTVNTKFDGIISSMTLHHLEDTKAILKRFYSVIKSGAFIAIADLNSEDGSFHTENTGVFHDGFEPEELIKLAQEVGFINVKTLSASSIQKEQGDYPVFLLIAEKKEEQ